MFLATLPLAIYGVMAALSVIETPLTSNSNEATRAIYGDFVPVAYAQTPDTQEFSVLQQVDRALRDVVTRSRPSVVRVLVSSDPKPASQRSDEDEPTQRQNPFGIPWPFEFEHPDVPGFRQPREIPGREGLGSGVIVSEDGLILTNNHVVDGADHITVTLDDKREFDAEVVGADSRTDVAVIRIDASGLTPMPFGDSERVDVGEFVIAIGAPFQLSHSASFGIVSAKGRTNILPSSRDISTNPYEDFIQTDAAINPGNSGGPLLNIRGELIGINTAIASRIGQNAGIGFAIPSNLANKVMQDLVKEGRVVRAWLGVMIAPVDAQVATELGLDRPRGALISSVQEDSPASKVDLKPLDIIVSMDGIEVEGHNHLRNYISSSPVGREVKLGILRDGKPREVSVKLGELDDDSVAISRDGGRKSSKAWMGITVEDLTDEAAKELGYEGTDGVLVTDVHPNSPANHEGIQPNTLIIAVGDASVSSVADFKQAVEEAGKRVLIKWRRGPNYGLSVLKQN